MSRALHADRSAVRPRASVAGAAGHVGASAAAPAAFNGPAVVNATRGVVSDAEAQVWAAAFGSSLRWSVWAVEHRSQGIVRALAAPGHADAHVLLLVATAQAEHLELRFSEPPQLTRLLLVELTPAQQAAVAAAGGVSATFAWLASYVGPTELDTRSAGGAQIAHPILPAGASVDQLSVGVLAVDPSLGPIWREGYSRDCSASRDTQLCP